MAKVWTGNTLWSDDEDTVRAEFLNNDGSGKVFEVDGEGSGHFIGNIRVKVDADGYTTEGRILDAIDALHERRYNA